MDDLKQLKEKVDTVIPVNEGVASVKTANHNPFEKEVIEKVGRYTGFPFMSGRSPSLPITNGQLFWNNNAMNKDVNFDITLSKFTQDGNDIERILSVCGTGSLIHFKDFVGRSTTLEFIGFINTDDVLTVTVKGFAENTDYNYQVGELEPCMIEFIAQTKDSVLMFQDSGTPNLNEDLEIWFNENLGKQMFYYDNDAQKLYVFDYGSSDWIDFEGNFIPITGTTIGNPVTGDIEFDGERFILVNDVNYGYSAFVLNNDGNATIALQRKSPTTGFSMTFGTDILTDSFVVKSGNPNSRGMQGDGDFTSNIQTLDYTQKKYVDEKLDTKISLTQKGAPLGVATLDANGKLLASQTSAIAITDTFVVNSQASMLALTAETGDIAIRTDIFKNLILKGTNPTVLADWQELITPTNLIAGTGTANTIPKFTGVGTQGNSNISDNGTIVTLSTDASINGVRIGRGGGNIATNTAGGALSLNANTVAGNNTGFGASSLIMNQTGTNNTGIGSASFSSNISGNNNTAIGFASLLGSTLSNNTAIGNNSARFIADGVTILTTPSQCVYLGASTKASANGITNEIVIGYEATGSGANTVTIGNTSVTTTRLRGIVQGGSFVKDGAVATNVLLANGTDVASNTLIAKGSLIAKMTATGTTDQTISNTETNINFGNTELTYGAITRTGNNFIANANGLFTFNLQPQVTETTTNNVLTIYAKKNGVNVPNSAIKYSSTGISDTHVIMLQITLDLVSTDTVSFYGISSTVGGSVLDFTPEGGSEPATGSVIVDITGYKK